MDGSISMSSHASFRGTTDVRDRTGITRDWVRPRFSPRSSTTERLIRWLPSWWRSSTSASRTVRRSSVCSS
eukprot:3040021-Pyramimonas_sp.AAC.1